MRNAARAGLAVGLLIAPAAQAQAYDPLGLVQPPPPQQQQAPRAGPVLAVPYVPATPPPPGPPRVGALPAGSAPPAGTWVTVGPRPADYPWEDIWPANGTTPVQKLSQWTWPSRTLEDVVAFKEAGDYYLNRRQFSRSPDASYDTWIRTGQEYSIFALARLVGTMKVGERREWRGQWPHVGRLQVIGDHPVGPFPCRQVRLQLWENGKVEYERRSLFCYSMEPGEADFTWREVIPSAG